MKLDQKPDRDIPIPVRPQVTEALRLLKKGESWLFKNLNPQTVYSIVTRFQKSTGRRFTSAKQPDGNIRVWRLE